MAQIETDVVRVWIEGNLMFAYYKIQSVDVEEVLEAISTRLKLCNGVAYPCVVDATSIKTVTKEAREVMAQEEGTRHMSACAVIVGSPVNRLLGNLLLGINKPAIPFKLFTSRRDAVEWIESVVRK